MKELRFSPNLALLVIISFLTTMSFSPLLTSCGSSGSGSSSGSSSTPLTNTTHLGFTDPVTGTTDDSGAATVSSANIAKEVQLTITNTAGQVVSGLNIEYADSSDGRVGHIIISDPNEVYQSALVMFDTDDLSTTSASNVVAMSADGSVLPRAITITTAIIYIILTVLTAKAVYEIGTGIYELYGNPPTVSLLGDYVFACISTNQILTLMNIGINAFGLITAGSMSAAATGASAGTKTAWEAYGKDLAVDGAAAIGTKFGEYLSDEAGFDPAQEYCVLLVSSATQSARYSSAADLVALECNTASDCGVSSYFSDDGDVIVSEVDGDWLTYENYVLVDLDSLDYDNDGYSPNDGDCDDYNLNINPGFLEICGYGIDQDCTDGDMECSDDVVVDITSPPKTANCPEDMLINGICGGDTRGLTVMAEITGGVGTSAYVIVNGRIVQAEIENGFISTDNPALLKCQSSGWTNLIQVVAIDENRRMAMDEMEWVCNAEATDLLVMLTWDTCDTDLDLYVLEPSGDIRVNNGDWTAGSETSSAGVTYGYETNCYGPVYYAILEGAPVGVYTIRVHHNSGTQTPTATIRIIRDEGFDNPKTFTRELGNSDSTQSGTGNFWSYDDSWGTGIYLKMLSSGYWQPTS